jgi:hypothetical protein
MNQNLFFRTESLPGTTNRSDFTLLFIEGDGCFSTGNRLRITLKKIATGSEKVLMQYSNTQII